MSNENKKLTVCYFGIYDPLFSRNKIYIQGLRENGAVVIECVDRSSGWIKYWRLFQKHRNIRNSYDVMVVGYTGYIVVPLAKLITRKPVIFDALCSFYEAQIISRNAYKGIPFRKTYARLIDWMANMFADMVLVETEAQRQYFIEKLHVPPRKCAVLFTGVDVSEFFYDPKVAKKEEFTVVFRGSLTREAGVPYIVESAQILEDKRVLFVILGTGEILKELRAQIKAVKLKNLVFIDRRLDTKELRELMLSSHVSLGQFGDHERLERTIPHKAFESLAMKIPYITGRAPGIGELLRDGESCLMVNLADSKDIAKKILALKHNVTLQQTLAEKGYRTYQERFTPGILGKQLRSFCEGLVQVR